MATTNLFTHPAFKDGAFTANDPRVRAFALQKTMRAIDLGVELGAKVYVFWGGREGVETDAAKDPRDGAQALPRGARTSSASTCATRATTCAFALEPKPNEPRGDIYLPTVGHALHFIATLDHPEMVGVNPEVAHETMAGLNFLHARRAGAGAGKLFHIDLNDQAHRPLRPGLPLRRADLKARFFLVKLLEDVGLRRAAALRRARLPHRGRGGRLGLRARLHAHLPDSEGEGARSSRPRRASPRRSPRPACPTSREPSAGAYDGDLAAP